MQVLSSLEMFYRDRDEKFNGERFLRDEYDKLIRYEILSNSEPEDAKALYRYYLTKSYFEITGEWGVDFDTEFKVPEGLKDLFDEFIESYYDILSSFEECTYMSDDELDFKDIPSNSLYYFMLAYYKQRRIWSEIAELKVEQAQAFGRFLEVLNPGISVETEVIK